MNKTWLIGGLLIIFVLGAAQFLFPRSVVSPALSTATSTPVQNVSATTAPIVVTTADVQKYPAQNPLPLAAGDSIASWDFKGVYADDPILIAKAKTETDRLLGLIGKGTYSDTALYVGIANQYELLGDGKQEYDYLGRAIKADVNVTSGLPWNNLGVLMERLGALETARVAYEKATLIQSEMKQWHYAYLEFLTTRMKDNATDIEKAFAAAIKNLGQDADILQMYSEWKNS